MGDFTAIPSLALVEANRRLQELQAQVRSARQVEELPVGQGRDDNTPCQESSPALLPAAAALIATLPDHLGWGSAPLTAHWRRQQAQSAAGNVAAAREVAVVGRSTGPDFGHGVGGKDLNIYANCLLEPETTNWVKLYPDIGLGMLRQEMSAPGRVWLMLRYLDKDGQGNITMATAQAHLVDPDSPLRLCGRRQWRNLLRAGEGVFWQRDQERIWLYSAAKVAHHLGVPRLTGQPVALPVAVLLEGIGTFRAQLYTAFHSGRGQESNRGTQVKPIARATLAELSGVGASSQRVYEKQTRVQVETNFAIGELATEENQEARGWAQGQAVFTLIDYRGQQGEKGKAYLAWQLPNSYRGQHQQRPRGRQKRINRELKDLVMQGMPGNVGGRSETPPEKRYYPNGKAAAKACGRRETANDLYWPRAEMRPRGYGLWQQMGSR